MINSTNAITKAKISNNFIGIPIIYIVGLSVGRYINRVFMRITINRNSVGPRPLYEILNSPLR
jgi:hypothetical protein